MALLPKYLNFLRRFIHKTRRLILGPDWQRSTDAGLALAALDRLALLESQVNWRLLGLPSRIENLKMERLPLLADGNLAETALAHMRDFEEPPLSLIDNLFKHAGSPLCAVSSWCQKENELIARNLIKLVIIDPTDVFRVPGEPTLRGEVSLQLSIIDAAARWTGPEFCQIWLSNGIERLTPLQQQVLFLQARTGLRSGGVITGYFADYARCDAGAYWGHPSRLRPITKSLIEHLAAGAGLAAPQFQDGVATKGIASSVFEIRLK
ncbi:MAG: hypothetical protein WCL28_13665 [bacterium]